MNRVFRNVSILVGGAFAQRVMVNLPQPQYAFADTAPETKKDIVTSKNAAAEDDDENLDLDPEKEDCPFCKHFLMSPCAKEFRRWSRCVDKCKADESDFITVCETYTAKLLDCTSSHTEYFKEMATVTVDETEGEADESISGDSVAVDEKISESEPIEKK